jgi:predicted Zn-dependent protease with MMP-like domain
MSYLSFEEFETLVGEVLSELPKDFSERIENVEIVVEEEPSAGLRKSMKLSRGETLLGLYQGIPLSHRSPTGYGGVLPDRILIFQKPIEASVKSKENLKPAIRRTLLHEIAHHFGISDHRLRELKAY